MVLGGTTDDSWKALSEDLLKIRSSWPTRGWSWDTKLSCLTSSFAGEYETQARASIAEALATEWTKANVATAPQRIKDLVDRAGGLRTGQYLFSGRPLGRLLAFGLWWPWRDDTTISFRLGLANVDEQSDIAGRFRDLFGVTL